MDYTWNLDPIYKGFDDPAFNADMGKLADLVEQLAALAGELETLDPAQGLRRGTDLLEELERTGSKLAEYAMLRQSVDATDPEAGTRLGQIMQIFSQAAAPEAAFQSWTAKLPRLMDLVVADEQLQEYDYRFREMVRSSRNLLPGQC